VWLQLWLEGESEDSRVNTEKGFARSVKAHVLDDQSALILGPFHKPKSCQVTLVMVADRQPRDYALSKSLLSPSRSARRLRSMS